MIQIDDSVRNKIQIVRAFAIIGVVVSHTLPLGFETIFLKPFTHTAVAVFLFLSGMLTPFHIDDVKKFYQKRIIRVLIPYIIWSLIYTLMFFAGGVFHGNLFGKFFYNLFTAQAAPPLYFILVYIQLVLVTPFIENFFNSKYKILGFIIPFLSSVLVLYLPCIITHGMNMWHRLPFITWFIFYYLGFLLSNNKIELKILNSKFLLPLLTIFSFSAQIAESAAFYNFSLQISLSQLKITSIISSVFICIYAYKYILDRNMEKVKPFIIKGLVSIGNYSFGIYLVHIAVIFMLTDYFKLIPKDSVPLIIYTTVMFIISYFVVFIFSKIFGKNISKKLGFI